MAVVEMVLSGKRRKEECFWWNVWRLPALSSTVVSELKVKKTSTFLYLVFSHEARTRHSNLKGDFFQLTPSPSLLVHNWNEKMPMRQPELPFLKILIQESLWFANGPFFISLPNKGGSAKKFPCIYSSLEPGWLTMQGRVLRWRTKRSGLVWKE